VDAFMCYKQKCKVVSLNLAHPVDFDSNQFGCQQHALVAISVFFRRLKLKLKLSQWKYINFHHVDENYN